MITIKHKQTNETKDVSVYSWDQGKYNQEAWEVVEIKDVVMMEQFVKGKWIERNRMEYQDMRELLRENPNDYRFSLLPTDQVVYTEIEAPYNNTAHIGNSAFTKKLKTSSNIILKNQYVAGIIITVIGGLILYLIIDKISK